MIRTLDRTSTVLVRRHGQQQQQQRRRRSLVHHHRRRLLADDGLGSSSLSLPLSLPLPLPFSWRRLPVAIRRTDSVASSAKRGCSSTSTSTSTPKRSGFVAWYSKQLDERPWTTKIVSSALIATAGDLIGQALETNLGTAKEKQSRTQTQTQTGAAETVTSDSLAGAIDWHRTGRFFLTGAFWVAPVTNIWFGFLSTRLLPGAAVPKRVLQRLAVDQLGFAPIFCSAYMGLLWLLEGKPSEQVKADLVEAVPTLVASNWKLWIPAQGLMFAVVPLPFQVVYANLVGLVWTVYMSYASTQLAPDHDHEPVE